MNDLFAQNIIVILNTSQMNEILATSNTLLHLTAKMVHITCDCKALLVLLTKCGPKRFLLTKCGPYFISVVPASFVGIITITSSAMFTYP